MNGAIFPLIVFVVVYISIIFEIVNKAAAVLLGAAVLMAFGSIDTTTAVGFVDFETLMLLLGMMTIVAILRESHFFTIVSVRIAELTGGSPLKILILFSIVTAVMSAFLDNVTTVIIIVPIIIQLTDGIGLDAKLFVISQAVISNIGGTSTLIGDPPNMIIGSKVGLTFNQFIFNLIIPVSISFCFALLYIWFRNREKFKPINRNLSQLFLVNLLIAKIKLIFLNISIDRLFIIKSLVGLAVVVLLFFTHSFTHMSPGVIAIMMAALLLIVTKVDVERILEDVEWDTLLFFIGLFVLVGTLEEKGVVGWIAEDIFRWIGTNPYVVVLFVLWFSAVVCNLLGNIPFTIAMVPIVQAILVNTPIPNGILWWSLALGACFGGNFTIIGATANIVSVATSKKLHHDISYLEFMRTSIPITLLTLVVSSFYLMGYLWISLL